MILLTIIDSRRLLTGDTLDRLGLVADMTEHTRLRGYNTPPENGENERPLENLTVSMDESLSVKVASSDLEQMHDQEEDNIAKIVVPESIDVDSERDMVGDKGRKGSQDCSDHYQYPTSLQSRMGEEVFGLSHPIATPYDCDHRCDHKEFLSGPERLDPRAVSANTVAHKGPYDKVHQQSYHEDLKQQEKTPCRSERFEPVERFLVSRHRVLVDLIKEKDERNSSQDSLDKPELHDYRVFFHPSMLEPMVKGSDREEFSFEGFLSEDLERRTQKVGPNDTKQHHEGNQNTDLEVEEIDNARDESTETKRTTVAHKHTGRIDIKPQERKQGSYHDGYYRRSQIPLDIDRHHDQY